MPDGPTAWDWFWLAAGAAVTLLIGSIVAIWTVREWRERFR